MYSLIKIRCLKFFFLWRYTKNIQHMYHIVIRFGIGEWCSSTRTHYSDSEQTSLCYYSIKLCRPIVLVWPDRGSNRSLGDHANHYTTAVYIPIHLRTRIAPSTHTPLPKPPKKQTNTNHQFMPLRFQKYSFSTLFTIRV